MQQIPEQRVTDEGRWELDPGGAWILVEPSAAWIAERDADPGPIEPPPPLVVLAEALREPLGNLTDSSGDVATRTALLGLRDALDGLIDP